MKTHKFLKGRVTALLLALCMVTTMLPVTAFAEEHSHSGADWHSITMGEKYIKVDGVEQINNTLAAGNYRLDADISLAQADLLLSRSGTTTLCLNGHTVTCENYNRIYDTGNTPSEKGSITINGEGGKITGTSASLLCIYYLNATLNNVDIEGTSDDGQRRIVSLGNYGYTTTINGGTITTPGTNYGNENSFSSALNLEGSCVLNGVTVSATGTSGHGISLYRCQLTLKNCTVTGEACGINNLYSDLTVENSTITGNNGPGIMFGAVTVKSGTITGATDGILNSGDITLESDAVIKGQNGYAISHAGISGNNTFIVDLNGTPALNGSKGAILVVCKTAKSSIDAADYTGDKLTVDYESTSDDYTIVTGLTDATKDKFEFLPNDKYEVKYELLNDMGIYVIRGKPMQLTWYDKDGNDITGQLDKTYESSLEPIYYYSSWDYAARIGDSRMPEGPVVPGKLFLAWAYKVGENGTWTGGDIHLSQDTWESNMKVTDHIYFKPVYIDVFDGKGTEADPYQIKTAEDLTALEKLINDNEHLTTSTYGNIVYTDFDYGYIKHAFNNPDVWYKVMNDIDMSSVCSEQQPYGWKSIGYRSYMIDTVGVAINNKPSAPDGYTFLANFDGNDKAISNLYYADGRIADKGLFGEVGDYGGGVHNIIKNVKLTDVYIEDIDGNDPNRYPAWGGTLAGYVNLDVTVQNCTVTGTLKTYAPIPSEGYDKANGGVFGVISEKESGSTVTGIDKSGLVIISLNNPYHFSDDMAYKTEDNGIDIMGWYKNSWRNTVNNNFKTATKNMDGAAVTTEASFVKDEKYIKVTYTVTAGNTAVTAGKLGVFGEIMIGENDYAVMEVIKNNTGKVIGVKLKDDDSSSASYGAQFNVYFGGDADATEADTYWFGACENGSAPSNRYFTQLNADTASANATYQKDGSLYTGMTDTEAALTMSWQNINLAAGESKTYSFIIGVVDVPETHTHKYSTDWKSNGTNHWKECSCGNKTDVAAHDFKWVVDKEATSSATGSKHEECKTCGYKKAAVTIPATTPTTKIVATFNKKATPVVKLSAKKRTLTVKLKKAVAGAKKYQVKYATNKKLKKAKTKTLNKTLKIKKLAKKTYYVKVRAVSKVNGKTVYGKWSKTLKVKVK